MAQSGLLDSKINLGLPSEAPEEFTHPQVRGAVNMSINGMNNILRAIEQYGGVTQKPVGDWSTTAPQDTILRANTGRFYLKASEDIAFGALINIHNSSGAKAQNATSVGKPAHGYCNVSGGVIAGADCEVILGMGLVGIGGVSPGDSVYLSATPGLAALSPDLGAGRIEQYVGFGVDTDLVYIQITLGAYIQH